MRPLRTPARALILTVSVLLAASAGFVVQADAAASTSFSQAEQARQQLNLDLLAASASGYTEQNVAPILQRRTELINAPAPKVITDRAGFYRSEAQELAGLRLALTSLQARQLETLQRAAAGHLESLQAELAQDEKAGVKAGDLVSLREQATTLGKTLAVARTPVDYRRTYSALGTPIDAAQALRLSRLEAIASVQPEVDRLLKLSATGNLGQVRWIGQQALAEGRNQAAYESYFGSPPAAITNFWRPTPATSPAATPRS